MNFYFPLLVGIALGYLIFLIINPYKFKIRKMKDECEELNAKRKRLFEAFQVQCKQNREMKKKHNLFDFELIKNIDELCTKISIGTNVEEITRLHFLLSCYTKSKDDIWLTIDELNDKYSFISNEKDTNEREKLTAYNNYDFLSLIENFVKKIK